MNLQITYLDSKHRLAHLMVSRDEGLRLIKSLTTQLIENNPNVGRLESRCKGDCEEFTIMILGDN